MRNGANNIVSVRIALHRVCTIKLKTAIVAAPVACTMAVRIKILHQHVRLCLFKIENHISRVRYGAALISEAQHFRIEGTPFRKIRRGIVTLGSLIQVLLVTILLAN